MEIILYFILNSNQMLSLHPFLQQKNQMIIINAYQSLHRQQTPETEMKTNKKLNHKLNNSRKNQVNQINISTSITNEQTQKQKRVRRVCHPHESRTPTVSHKKNPMTGKKIKFHLNT